MRYVAFLRAINTGNRRVTNEALVACFESMGLDDIFGFLASGNVAFTTERQVDDLEPEIEAVLEARLGYEVPSFIRTGSQVARIAEAQPFDTEHLARSEGRVQVAVLRDEHSMDASLSSIDIPEDDRVIVDGREMYWLPKKGISDSTLDVGAVESAVGPMTIRTQRTFSRLAAKLD